MKPLESAEFSVDTGLFRQLGELLVGRDSTALVELVKNAYDADATAVVLRSDRMDDPLGAILTVSDNGTGMTELQFRQGFLRVAARGKTAGDRRSPIYQRRFTGEKGVGRLAAHKLAAQLEIATTASVNAAGLAAAAALREKSRNESSLELLNRLSRYDRVLLLAEIDWDLIEAVDTLADVKEGLAYAVDKTSRRTPTGTTLTLRRLRHLWTESDVRDLVRQLHNFEPPAALIARLPKSILPGPLLFREPVVRDAEREDPGLNLELEGDFNDPEEFWGSVQNSAEWIMEIRARREGIKYSIAPTRVGEAGNSFGRPTEAVMAHPVPEIGPFFDARIFLRPGVVPTLQTVWTELNSGIRVYLEGFRVLPYGEPRNDWLSLDFDYTKRNGQYQIDPLLIGPADQLSELRSLKDRDVSLRLMANRAFFGAVFLTESGIGGLRTLVNREGFVPDAAYERLVNIVGTGVRLLQRVRALASFELAKSTAEQKAERLRAEAAAAAAAKGNSVSPEDDDSTPNGEASNSAGEGVGEERDDEDSNDEIWTALGTEGSRRGSAARLATALSELRVALGLPSRDEDVVASSAITRAVINLEDAADRLVEDSSLLRVLASVGAQLSAFTHEIAQLIPVAVSAERSLAPVQGHRWPPQAVEARRKVVELRRALERQTSYLVDVASAEGRRRRSRQNIAALVEVAELGFQGTAAARSIEFVNRIPKEIQTPPMFRSEFQAVLTNLLSNAIKAAGGPGTIEVSASALKDGVRIVIQNTGVKVRKEDAERWFTPYASTSIDVDPVLGQGMGLGLPITRDLISEYGGSVKFVDPSDKFSTAVEVVITE